MQTNKIKNLLDILLNITSSNNNTKLAADEADDSLKDFVGKLFGEGRNVTLKRLMELLYGAPQSGQKLLPFGPFWGWRKPENALKDPKIRAMLEKIREMYEKPTPPGPTTIPPPPLPGYIESQLVFPEFLSRRPESVETRRVPERIENPRVPETVVNQRVPETVTNRREPERLERQRVPETVTNRREPERLERQRVPEQVERWRVPERVSTPRLPEQVERLEITKLWPTVTDFLHPSFQGQIEPLIRNYNGLFGEYYIKNQDLRPIDFIDKILLNRLSGNKFATSPPEHRLNVIAENFSVPAILNANISARTGETISHKSLVYDLEKDQTIVQEDKKAEALNRRIHIYGIKGRYQIQGNKIFITDIDVKNDIFSLVGAGLLPEGGITNDALQEKLEYSTLRQIADLADPSNEKREERLGRLRAKLENELDLFAQHVSKMREQPLTLDPISKSQAVDRAMERLVRRAAVIRAALSRPRAMRH